MTTVVKSNCNPTFYITKTVASTPAATDPPTENRWKTAAFADGAGAPTGGVEITDGVKGVKGEDGGGTGGDVVTVVGEGDEIDGVLLGVGADAGGGLKGEETGAGGGEIKGGDLEREGEGEGDWAIAERAKTSGMRVKRAVAEPAIVAEKSSLTTKKHRIFWVEMRVYTEKVNGQSQVTPQGLEKLQWTQTLGCYAVAAAGIAQIPSLS